MKTRTVLLYCLVFLTSVVYSNVHIISQNDSYSDSINQLIISKYANIPDSAILILKQSIDRSVLRQDTLRTIKHLHSITRFYINKLDYINAYESILEALRLSEILKDSANLSLSYKTIAELYAVYGQQDNSKRYSNKSIAIDKILVKKNKAHTRALIENYFQAIINNILFEEFDIASAYIDSSLWLSNSIGQDTLFKCYMYSKRASIDIIKGNYNNASKILYQAKSVFECLDENDPEYYRHISYLVFIYAYLGDLHSKLNELEKSERFYTMSLAKMDEHNAHVGYKSYLLFNLAEVYKRAGKVNEAFEAMRLSKVIYDNVYGTSSNQNIRLLEMISSYEKEISEKDIELYNNAIQLAEKERSLLKIKVLLFSIFFLIVLGVLLIRNRIQRTRHSNEKAALLRENTLKENVTKEILEMKNKELTTYTLQFIEKDKTIAKLIALIKGKKDKKQQQQELKSIQASQNSWEEFNHRFNSVNNGFYERLSNKYPDLSPTELKHCALIKLNFSSKEMAHLLGLTTSSVHVSRSRLRKKMDIDRDVNLSSFMSKI